jgi:chaperonin cofactor prefoldin
MSESENEFQKVIEALDKIIAQIEEINSTLREALQ